MLELAVVGVLMVAGALHYVYLIHYFEQELNEARQAISLKPDNFPECKYSEEQTVPE